MAGLPKQLITVPLTGLQSKADPKSAPLGVLSIAENVWASRRTAGGIELRKRYGFTSKTRNIQGGGTLASGRTLGVLNDELVLCDGLKAYGLSLVLDKWLPRGAAHGISADVTMLSGNETSQGNDLIEKLNVDRAETNGYACVVSSADSGTGLLVAKTIIEDLATGDVIATQVQGVLVYRARVVVVGTVFYIFSWTGSSKIRCQKIDTATPTTFGAQVDVATDVHAAGIFDVFVDQTNTRMVVGYRNTTPTLTLLTWTTGMAVGVSAAYASIDPDACIGFLVYSFANGNGYVGVGLQSGSVRLLKFSASSMVVATNTLLEAASEVPRQITGYNAPVSGVDHLNVFWTTSPVTVLGHNSYIRGYGDGTLYQVMLSVGLASRPFKIGSKWHLVAAYQSETLLARTHLSGQQRTLLLELTENATVAAGGSVCVAGYLLANDSSGAPVSPSCLPSVTSSSTRATFATCGILSVGADVGIGLGDGTPSVTQQRYTVLKVALDWSGAGLGKPVAHNGTLHIPAAASKIYDGYFLVEDGFYVNPEAPYGGSINTGGNLDVDGTYDYCVVFARADKAGRLVRSAPGPVHTVVLNSGANQVTRKIPTLRATDADSAYNLNPDVTQARIEIYRTENGLPNFYLCAVLTNFATADFITFTDSLSDANLAKNEILYTSGDVLDHLSPPAVKVLHRHGDRLFAITGDRSIWHTNLSSEGIGTEWSDALRFTVEQGDGAPLAFATVDSTLAIFKAERTLLLQGIGPDDKGNNEFAMPVALQDDIGAIGPGGVVETSGGAVVRSGKSWWLLGRDLAYQPIEAPAGYDALSPAFGAPVGGGPASGRPMVVLPTNDSALVYDWQLQQFLTWTGASSYLAGVCAVRWRNSLAILKNDGTVRQEVVGQYNDDTAAIAERVKVVWVELGNAHVYKALVMAEFLSSTSVVTTIARNRDPSTAASKTNVVTTGSKTPLVHAPNTGRFSALELLIEESSTTEGIRISQIDLEVGLKPGAIKHKSASYAT